MTRPASSGTAARSSLARTAAARWSRIAGWTDDLQRRGRGARADAAAEARYQQLASERPEEGGDETLHWAPRILRGSPGNYARDEGACKIGSRNPWLICMARDDLVELAYILASWAAPAPLATIYLFGSRVRGDHRLDSDVDIFVHWTDVDDDLLWWWSENNETDFAAIKALLPGPLKILESDDPLGMRIRAAEAVHKDGNIICVWLPPKP